MSNPRKGLLLFGTHVVALAVGVLLFRPTGSSRNTDREGQGTGGGSTALVAEPGLGHGDAATKAPARAHDGPASSSVHVLAWKALADDGLNRPERLKASAVILRQWIKEDWHAALDAVMNETPDDFSLLLGEFDTVFADKAAEVWPIIESKRYGVMSVNLRHAWQKRLLRLDAAELDCVEKQLPEKAREGLRPPKPNAMK